MIVKRIVIVGSDISARKDFLEVTRELRIDRHHVFKAAMRRTFLDHDDLSIALDDSARELLTREGYDPSFGARPLKRAIQTLIQNPLAMKLLRGEIQPGETLTVSARDGEMQFAADKAAVAA